MARAILFDLNGVIEDVNPFLKVRDDLIVATVGSLASEMTIRQTAAKIRLEYDTVMSSNLAEFHLMFWDDLLRQLAIKSQDDLLFRIYEKFVTCYLPVSRVFPDTRDLLESLPSDFEFGVLSNANSFRARSFLKYHSLDHLFKSILISHDTPYAKPDKEIFLLAAQRFGKHPGDVIMIGDRLDNDIQGAKDAGMIPIFLDRTGVSSPSDPSHKVLSTLAALKDTIMAVANGELNQSAKPVRKNPRVVIVCGGKGSRLKPQLGDKQKCLAVVKGKPILFHTIDALMSAGLREFDLVAGDSTGAVEQAIRQHAEYAPYDIRVLPISAPSTGKAMQDYWRTRKPGDNDIVYSHGNIIVDPTVVKEFIKNALADERSDVTLLGSPQWTAEKHAALVVRNGIIEKIVTDPDKHTKGDLCSVGVAFVKGYAHLDQGEIDDEGMFEDIVEILRQSTQLRVAYRFSDRSWEHLGVPKDWARLAVEG
jgi:HAD superfamily hydrolase (TIGR01509 family)